STFPNLTDEDGKILTLYAIWHINIYTVFYHENGGSGTMDHQFVVYGDTPNLRKNTFTKTYSDFVGWALAPNGTVVYGDEAKLPGELFPENNSLNLYAIWENWRYVIHFDANGGSGTMPDFAADCNIEIQLPANEFTSETSFKGWSLTPGGKIEYSDRALATNISKGAPEVTLYASWVIPPEPGPEPSGTGGSDFPIALVGALVAVVIVAGAAVYFLRKR
ncbi:MAG: InlB B-repeat-containing protein, partial [archaeon]|nr:InlB B-repeat-containing protein [archaeon]